MVTRDRAEVIHFAGFHHLSPALGAAGEPAFSSGAGDGLARCGWAPWFEALSRRGLAVAFERKDASSVRFVPESEARDHPGAGSAVEHARRFWRAWRGK
jgi:hypothetical protein